MKTTQAVYKTLEDRLRLLHSYVLPEIVALKTDFQLLDYGQWVAQNVTEAR